MTIQRHGDSLDLDPRWLQLLSANDIGDDVQKSVGFLRASTVAPKASTSGDEHGAGKGYENYADHGEWNRSSTSEDASEHREAGENEQNAKQSQRVDAEPVRANAKVDVCHPAIAREIP